MLTRTGLGVVIGGILTAAIGFRLRYSEFIVVGAMAIVATLVAAAVARRGAAAVAVRSPLPTRVAVGDEIRCRVTISPIGSRPVGFSVLCDRLGEDIHRVDADRSSTQASMTFSYSLVARRRGPTSVGPISLTRSDPLGLAVGEHDVSGGTAHVLVHPKPEPLGGRRMLERLASVESARRRGGSDPTAGFQSLRPYVPGDDTRTIHWPTTAKTGSLMVREFTDPSRPSLAIVLLTDRSGYHGDHFEEAVRIAASLATFATGAAMELILATTDRAAPGSTTPFTDEGRALDLLAQVSLTTSDTSIALGEVARRLSYSTCAYLIGGTESVRPSGVARLAAQVVHVSVADTADGEPKAAAGTGDDIVVPSAEAFARWWRWGA